MCPERRCYGVLPLHRALQGAAIHRPAIDDVEPAARGECLRRTHECRHCVTTRDGHVDDLASKTASPTQHEQLHAGIRILAAARREAA